MKFRIRVKTDLASAEVKGRELVQYFNDTLRPYENPRTFLLAEMVSNGTATEAIEHHEWEKTNLVTIFEHRRSFDTARCTKCGITAKRFGLGGHVLDPAYKAKAFKACDTARLLLAKRKARRS